MATNPTKNTPPDSNISGQLKQIGREAGVLMNKLTGEAYKLGSWRLFKMMNTQVMLITTVGRKSGKQFTTPIGYARDSEYIYVATRRDNGSGRPSNWFLNLKANGKAFLRIEDKKYRGEAEAFDDVENVTEIMKKWAKIYPQYFRFFGVKTNGRNYITDEEIAATARKVVAARIKIS